MPIPRRPPFDRWPVQHQDDRYGYAWYCGKGLIVSHITTPHGSTAAAQSYLDYEDRVLREHAEECLSNGGLYVVHDWRAMESYDHDARKYWQGRMRQRPKGYLRGSTVCIASAGALLRMAVQAANLVASVVHGVQVELSTDLEATLREHKLAPSGPG
jgi:hypothetical protein